MMSFSRAALAVALLSCRSCRRGLGPGAGKERAVGFGNFGSSKEPIKIDADRLDVFDKEGRAVFTGNVVAVQGESTMKCTIMTVFYEQRDQNGGAGRALRRRAPTTARSRRSTARGRSPSCRRPRSRPATTPPSTAAPNKILLIGNATLSDGPNVTKGERVVYDLNTGVANVETTPGGRVRALFVPGSGGPAPTGAGNAAPAAGTAKPKPQQKPATN